MLEEKGVHRLAMCGKGGIGESVTVCNAACALHAMRGRVLAEGIIRAYRVGRN